jgi:hypothetical protein
MSKLPPSRRSLVLLAALVVLVAAAGTVYATIPNDGVIHACYSKSGGSLRVIDASVTTCKASETSLTWNVEGVAGPQGDPGAQGDPGISGFTFVKGDVVDIAPGQTVVAGAQCPAGMVAIAGGFAEVFGPVGISVDTSYNDGGSSIREWLVSVTNNGAVNAQLVAQASCAIVSQ